jgi:hypothetical protein
LEEFFLLCRKTQEMDEDLHAVHSSSPKAKDVMGPAYRAQRFMRDLDSKDNGS